MERRVSRRRSATLSATGPARPALSSLSGRASRAVPSTTRHPTRGCGPGRVGLQPGGRGFESHPLHSTSDSMSPAHWLPFLTELADRADELALRWFRAAGLRVADKADRSPVTEADQAIEAMARELVHEHHPQLGVLGEEEGEAAGTAPTRLIIDPIDGTRNFRRGIPGFATLVAIQTGGEGGAGGGGRPRPRGPRGPRAG